MAKKVLPAFLLALITGLWAATAVFAGDYQTGPGDVLRIIVYDNSDLSATVQITDTGTIVMPLIGKVDISKLTVGEVTEKITRMLADGYLVSPQVNIFVEEYRSKKVVVLGKVNSPGLIDLTGPITFLELLSRAGGLKVEAGRTATIQRSQGKGEKVIVVDLKALIENGDLSQNVAINDGDSVFISKSGMCYITGEVASPGTYPCGDNSTVLKLVALAGGFTGKASKGGINIVRMINNEKTVLEDVDLYTTLKHNDVLVVPESFF